MSPPFLGPVKIQAYTLACNALLGRLKRLRMATRKEARLDYERCLQSFNKALEFFFEETLAKTLPEASEKLRDTLRGNVSRMQTLNPEIAQIFSEVSEELVPRAEAGWDLGTDLEGFHQQGRTLSIHMFAAAAPDNLDQLSRHCQLTYQASPEEEHQLLRAAVPFGQTGAPLAFLGTNRPKSFQGERPDRVIVRFNRTHLNKTNKHRDLFDYLFYPFGFLHEYSAHLHARDYGSERFNDGWMVFAANLFLETQWRLARQLGLDQEQINLFANQVLPNLNPIPRRACQFTGRFRHFLLDEFPRDSKFWEITLQLAAFQAEKGENTETWHDEFINALEGVFEKDKEALMQALQDSANVRVLLGNLLTS